MNYAERLIMRHKHLSAKDGPLLRSASLATKDVFVDSPKSPRDVVMIATSPRTDLDDEVVLPGGADVEYFRQNRALFADHEYTIGSVVAKLRSINPVKLAGGASGYRVRATMLGGPDHPLGDVCLSLAREGIVGCSIGMKILDSGAPTASERKEYPFARSIVRAWQWLELSLTCLPCNPDCSGTVQIEAPKSLTRRYFVV